MASRLTTQLTRPTGLLGRQVTREMATTNAAMIRAAIEALEVRTGDCVLEIGFGSPQSLARLTQLAHPGVVIGVDHSPVAVRAARRRMKREISAASVRVFEAGADALPVETGSADRVLAINTVTYWPEPDAGFAELARVASREARLVIGVRSPEVLRRLGIFGDRVHHLEEADLEQIAVRHGLSVVDACRDSDRRGKYLLVQLARDGRSEGDAPRGASSYHPP